MNSPYDFAEVADVTTIGQGNFKADPMLERFMRDGTCGIDDFHPEVGFFAGE